MAEGKNKVIFYTDWAKVFLTLNRGEAGDLIHHFCKYITDQNPEAPNRITELTFLPMMQTLKRDLKKYEATVKKNSENAHKRWDNMPNDAVASSGINTNAKNADKDIDKDIDKDRDIDTDTKKNKYVFSRELIDFGFDEMLVNDWMIVRSKKKCANTETAFNGFITQVKKSQRPINEVLRICVERSWGGFDAKWLEKEININNGKKQISNSPTESVNNDWGKSHRAS